MTQKKEIKITLYHAGLETSVRPGTPLMDILHEYGIEFPCGGKGICGSCKVKILKGNIPTNEKHRSRLSALGLPENMRLACMSAPDSDVTIEIPQLNSVILADNSPFEFKPLPGYGIAVDLGTTTLVAQLLDLTSGQVLNVATARNPQGKYGADIISRIEYGLHKAHWSWVARTVRYLTPDLDIHIAAVTNTWWIIISPPPPLPVWTLGVVDIDLWFFISLKDETMVVAIPFHPEGYLLSNIDRT